MSDKLKKTLGWNPTYFGEPKPGSLAAVIADVTTKQNAVVGDKPEVQSSAAVQAKEQQAKSEAYTMDEASVTVNTFDSNKPMSAIKADAKKHGVKITVKKGKGRYGADQAIITGPESGIIKYAKAQLDVRKARNMRDLKKELGETMDSKANDKMDSSKDMRKKNKKDAEGEKHSDPVDIKGEDVNKEFEKAQQGKIKSLVDTIKDMYYSEAKQEDEGNAFGKALMAAKKNGEKEFVVGGKKYNVEQELDKVNPTALKKKFKDRKDKDIDNDGDVDDSDRYLHKRRKAISKEID